MVSRVLIYTWLVFSVGQKVPLELHVIFWRVICYLLVYWHTLHKGWPKLHLTLISLYWMIKASIFASTAYYITNPTLTLFSFLIYRGDHLKTYIAHLVIWPFQLKTYIILQYLFTSASYCVVIWNMLTIIIQEIILWLKRVNMFNKMFSSMFGIYLFMCIF